MCVDAIRIPEEDGKGWTSNGIHGNILVIRVVRRVIRGVIRDWNWEKKLFRTD